MGAIAARLADHTIVTSDNPRSEDPQAIVEQILAGIEDRAGDARRSSIATPRSSAPSRSPGPATSS